MSQATDYQKGYISGRKKLKKEIDFEACDIVRKEYWLKFYTAILPAILATDNWTTTSNDGTITKITRSTQRIDLAASLADTALNVAITKWKIK